MALYLHFHPITVTPYVSGVQSGSDPIHPTEVYFGSPAHRDVNNMLLGLGISVYPEDKFSVFPNPSLGLGSRLTIERATPVNVNDAGHVRTYRTWATDVSGLLAENNIQLLGQDSAEPSVTTPISPNLVVKITRVAEVDLSVTETIDFKVIQKQSVDLEKGQTQIEIKGVKGSKEVIYTIKRVDGVEVSRVVKSNTVTKNPVTQVVIVGIGPKLAKSGPYVDIINAAAKKYLINGTALMCLMMAESNGHATSGYPDGPYQGLFQYDPGYWTTASAQAGFAGASIIDPTAQIYTTAYELTHGQSRRWPPWTNKGCYLK